MTYRSKSAPVVLEQMKRLSARYRLTAFEAVDNILDYRYIEELCKPLADSRIDFRLFYEVKANLKREHLRALARAGINVLQPGIESLNSHILGLMRKGTTMLHNVRCLKWAQYYGIHVMWNILTGFPGETEDDYQQQQALLPLLRHLRPPANCGRIWLERFSPYFFDGSFPLSNVRPLDAYRFIYPEDQIEIAKVAYFFDYDMAETVASDHYTTLQASVTEWKAAWTGITRPFLGYHCAGDWMRIVDHRGARKVTSEFDGLHAAAYESCMETERTPEQVCETLASPTRGHINHQTIRGILDTFCAYGYAIEERGRYLALAMPFNQNW